jgi:hypothetical protein
MGKLFNDGPATLASGCSNWVGVHGTFVSLVNISDNYGRYDMG